MIAAELRGGNRPSLNEALGWIGLRVDDIYGVAIGRLEDVWIDPGTGEPRWLLVKEGRFGGRSTLVPFSDATAGEGSVWIPYERDVVREAPQIEPGVPLTQQVEATLRNHYAANTAAAVSHGSQAAPGEPHQTAPQDRATTHATIRLAATEPPPEPIAPPRLPERPPPPVNPPSGQEQASPAFGQAPPAFGFEASGRGQPQAPPPRQQDPRQPYPPQQPQPQQPYQEQFAQPPPAATPYQPPQQQPPPPQQQPQEPPPAPDTLASLADLPAGHTVEIELTGNLTISGELRGVRIIPPDPGSGRRG